MTLPSEKIFGPRAEKPRTAEPPEEVAPRTLREFVDDVRQAARFSADFHAELARLQLPGDGDSDLLFQVSQKLFEADITRRGEFKDYVTLRKLRQTDRSHELREQTLALNREKFHFRAADAVFAHFLEFKAIHDNQALPPAAKIEAMRQILFAALPAPTEDADLPDPDADENDLA